MTTWRWLAVVVLIGSMGALCLADPAQAQGKKQKQSEAEAQADDVRILATAAEVTEFGRKTMAPEALVTAAGLLLKVNALTRGKLGTLDVPVEDEKGNKVNAPAVKEKSLAAQAEELFKEARVYGAELKPGTVEALIKAAKARKYDGSEEFNERGAFGGPKRISRFVQSGGLHIFTIHFQGRQRAAIAFQSNRPVRFRIIAPGQGELVSALVTTSYYTWTPGGNVAIKIYVQNLGQNSQYTITTN